MTSTKKLKLEELGRIDVETFKHTKKTPLVVVLEKLKITSRTDFTDVHRLI